MSNKLRIPSKSHQYWEFLQVKAQKRIAWLKLLQHRDILKANHAIKPFIIASNNLNRKVLVIFLQFTLTTLLKQRLLIWTDAFKFKEIILITFSWCRRNSFMYFGLLNRRIFLQYQIIVALWNLRESCSSFDKFQLYFFRLQNHWICIHAYNFRYFYLL